MADLITLARAKQQLGGRTVDATGTPINVSDLTVSTDESNTLSALITEISKTIEIYCRRKFTATTYEEVIDGSGTPELHLRQFPVSSIQRVAYRPTPVIQIINTSTSNARAVVNAVASSPGGGATSGFLLTRTSTAGVENTDTVSAATYPTVTLIAAAITALGNGWSAFAVSPYGSRASLDFAIYGAGLTYGDNYIQGALNAMNVYAEFNQHVEELSKYTVNARTGIMYRSEDEIAQGFQNTPLTWHGGRNYWRVKYTAGFGTIPEQIQHACAVWVARQFWQTKRDPAIIDSFSGGTGVKYDVSQVPTDIQVILNPYIKRVV